MSTIANSSGAYGSTPASIRMAGSATPLKIDRGVRGDEMKPVYAPGMPMTDIPEDLLHIFMNFPQIGYMTRAATIGDSGDGTVHLPARKDVYAKIEDADGESVASVSNDGTVKISAIASDRLRMAIDDRSLYAGIEGKTGPELAEIVAGRVAALESRSIVKSESALTQSHFEALANGPAGWQDMPTVDFLALRQGSKFDIHDKARAEMMRRATV